MAKARAVVSYSPNVMSKSRKEIIATENETETVKQLPHFQAKLHNRMCL